MGRVTQSSSGGAVTVAGTASVDQVGFDTVSAGGQVSVGLTSVTLLSANPGRKYAHIFNNSGSTIFIQYASNAVLNQGIRIPPNAFYTIETNNLWLGAVNAVGVENAQLIDVLEGE